jgi:DNA-binding MarR family transcriptional regulator/N-acetylglutamate synthase-like GNAT family acetyltransferase
MTEPVSPQAIAGVRAFNRFYTRRLGVLDQQVMNSPYSLTEARVLYELALRSMPTARDIAGALGLDAGYLSRIVQNFTDKGLVTRRPAPADRRQYLLSLTAKGRLAFGRLNQVSHNDVAAMLATLGPAQADRMVQAMTTIRRMLGDDVPGATATFRAPQPGDLGWVVQSHAAVYAAEYGFGTAFEGLVAGIVAEFARSFDAARERCWIAEMDGAPVGSVFLVRQSDNVAKLRLLLVDPAGRGQGLGRRLVLECIVFARQCGYREITLWTHSILLAARQIYRDAGFVLVDSTPHRSFGPELTGETWELALP